MFVVARRLKELNNIEAKLCRNKDLYVYKLIDNNITYIFSRPLLGEVAKKDLFLMAWCTEKEK